MKFSVIGWTNYEDGKYPEHQGDFGAVEFAVEAAIRAGGYRFGGDTHQGAETGTPVLNDGTRVCFSLREWGAVMAEALSLYGQDGLNYMEWYMDLEKVFFEGVELVLPPKGIDRSRIVKRRELSETFSVPLSPAAFEAVSSGKKTAVFFPKEGDHDRICRGDLLAFGSGDAVCRGHVTRTEVFSYRELFQDGDAASSSLSSAAVRRARFGQYTTPSRLGELFTQTYPAAKQGGWVVAVSFRPEKA